MDRDLIGLGAIFLVVVFALLFVLNMGERRKIDGCRDAGGSMVGEVCIIHDDCRNLSTSQLR